MTAGWLRSLTLSLILLLSACEQPAPPARPAPPEDAPTLLTATLESAYAALAKRHVTPLDLSAFTQAGLKAIGVPQLTVTALDDGAQVGRALARSPELADEDLQQVLETFLEAGLAATLGPIRFTSYFTVQELQGFDALIHGMAGVGIRVGNHPRGLVIEEVRPKSPAARAELRTGDLILLADGQTLGALPSLEAKASALMGKAGQTLQLTVQSEGQVRSLTLIREAQTLNQFQPEERLGTLGYVPLRLFDAKAAAHVQRGYRRLRRSGALEGLILDLRDNGGGSVSQAQQLLDLFLPKDAPLFQIGVPGQTSLWQARSRAPIPADLPLVVLINANSASASEMVAGALQDNGRAVVLGSTSFGKGSKQVIYPLPNGGGLAITTDFIYRADGRPLSYQGIKPQVCAAQFQDPAHLIESINTAPSQGVARPCPGVERRDAHDIDLARALLALPEAYAAVMQQ